jgi:hypothetical protein
MLVPRHQPIVAPLVSVNYHDGPDRSSGVRHFATSANGVRALRAACAT